MKIRYSYREITDNNAYSIYNKQKFVCKMFSTTYTKKKKKNNNFTINRRQDRIRIGYVLFYYIHIGELILDEGRALYLE